MLSIRSSICLSVILALAAPTIAASSSENTWLALMRPAEGVLSIASSLQWNNEENTYPELWGRVNHSSTNQTMSIGVWHRTKGPLQRWGLGEAVITNISLSRQLINEEITTWAPENPISIIRDAEEWHTQIVLAWQGEYISPLWHVGGQYALRLDAATASSLWQETSLWLARIYEPALLSLHLHRATRANQHINQASVGGELAINTRLALAGKTFFYWQQHPNAAAPRTPILSWQLGATIRNADQSGWSATLTLDKNSQRITVERSQPCP